MQTMSFHLMIFIALPAGSCCTEPSSILYRPCDKCNYHRPAYHTNAFPSTCNLISLDFVAGLLAPAARDQYLPTIPCSIRRSWSGCCRTRTTNTKGTLHRTASLHLSLSLLHSLIYLVALIGRDSVLGLYMLYRDQGGFCWRSAMDPPIQNALVPLSICLSSDSDCYCAG